MEKSASPPRYLIISSVPFTIQHISQNTSSLPWRYTSDIPSIQHNTSGVGVIQHNTSVVGVIQHNTSGVIQHNNLKIRLKPSGALKRKDMLPSKIQSSKIQHNSLKIRLKPSGVLKRKDVLPCQSSSKIQHSLKPSGAQQRKNVLP
ncbi:hypothetical protein R5R35_002370 [Gryllus longicercus]|uniref:Uncharacterized protein n=1 Tax=Gryllus longicercus TaxID=2509291 RepID=A0AAN9V4G9_9ORTH